MIKEYGQDEYDFSLRETQTYEIIEDVARMRSEIGILFLNDFNETVLGKILKSHELEFHPLFVARPHVFISRKHPLAGNAVLPMRNWSSIRICPSSRESIIRLFFGRNFFGG